MTKLKLSIALAAVLLVVVLTPLAGAREGESDGSTSTAAVVGDEISISDLGVEKTGILPTNTFYFVKEWGRGARLFFTSDPVKKADLELRVANEKAAELKKVAENNPQDSEALQRAIANYNKNVDRLRTRLEALKETSENPKIDELLNKLTERAVKHEQLFEELKAKHETLRDRLEQSQNKINETVIRSSEKLDKPDKFRERLEKVLDNQKGGDSKEVKTLRFLNRLETKASSTEIKERLLELKKIEKQRPASATSAKVLEEKREERGLEKRIKEEKAKIERTKRNIREIRSKLPASPSGTSEATASSTQ